MGVLSFQLQLKGLAPIAERQKERHLLLESVVQTPRKEAPFSPITLSKQPVRSAPNRSLALGSWKSSFYFKITPPFGFIVTFACPFLSTFKVLSSA